jgi:hypothetical protein
MAGALVVAQLGAIVHLATARHEVCVEHGELVEAGDSEPSRPADALDGVETHFDATAVAVEATGHDHCLASVFSRQSAAPRSSAEVAWVAAPTDLAGVRDCWMSHSVVDALRLAPKQSPPALS